ncbi:serine hydrolase domain-containing protein [Nesterenkonia muleiensis]|uniref:serine hydrolase domain-containing protein n=1 Tax=Nesterenkonia muleiensis TaxID=2282648 RepID=UPI000E7115FB|nr:serine hydrolase domain-containing protein [Nesterenkonia muleiensis]
MARTDVDAQQIRELLAETLPALIHKHGAPGATAGVLIDREIVDAAAGVLNLGTGVEATTDSLFQIGSITKVWTATLVMQLVDEGLLDLDEPIRKHLPEFTIADEQAAGAITARQLLSHQAGFEGDLFTDTGRGEDCVEKYVATLTETPQLFTPGSQFSYNNAGYVVLGRLVEVLRGKPYDQALTEHLIQPLDLAHTAPGPYEALLHRAALGHIPGPDGKPVPAPIWSMARSNAPAGSQLSMSAADLLRFAQLHIADGHVAGGKQVLSENSVQAMQQIQVEVPELGLLGDAWGLGWEIDETPAGRMVSHDGSTIGQNAFLRVIPELGIAVTLLTNGGDVMAIYRELFDILFEKLSGKKLLKPLPVPEGEPALVDEQTAARFLGTYSASVLDMVVSQDEAGLLWIDEIPKGLFVELGQPPTRSAVVPHRGTGLVTMEKRMGTHFRYAFLGDDGSGRAQFLHTGRAMPRST